MKMREFVLIGLAFNLFWLLAVMGQNQTLLLTIPLILLCWWRYQGAAVFGLTAGLLGIASDSLWLHLGIFAFDTMNIIPIWLMVLWVGFSSFVWVVRDTVLGYPKALVLIVFSIGGTLSYLAGYRLDAVAWPYGAGITLSILLVTWTVLGALLIWLTEQFSRRLYHVHIHHTHHE